MTRRVVALAALACLLAPVAAQASVRVRSVDASAYPTVRVTLVTSSPTTAPPTLRENGQPVTGVVAENLGRAKSIAMAIDRSQSMKGKPLREAIAAARAFVAAKAPADRIAVSAFATKALMLTGFSSATIDADTALRTITDVDDVQGTKLYDDLVLAAQSLADEPLESRVIIVVTDGNETRSEASLSEVITAAGKAHVSIYVIAIESSRFTPAPLKQMAAKTGGRYYGAASAEALKALYAAIASELKRTWRLEYLTSGYPGDRLRLDVSASALGSASARLTLPEGGGGPGGSSLPAAAFQAWGTGALVLTVTLIVLLGCGLAFAAHGDRLSGRLAPHVGRTPRRQERKRGRERLEAFGSLFRATEEALGHTRPWLRIQRLLERADVPLKTVEFLYLSVGCAFLLGLLSAVAGMSSMVILVCLVLGGLAPLVVVWWKARRRLNAFDNQLPDLLISIAASLKAGHSFKQGLQAIVDDGADPAAKELKRVLTETRLGRPMSDALAEMADRVGSNNFSFVVTAINIQGQVGGSLAGLFDMVADTVRQRQQFQRKIKGLTAMGRMSAYVLIGLPFFVAGALTLINPEYMDPLYNTSSGNKLIIAMFVMMAIGSAILKKMVTFKG